MPVVLETIIYYMHFVQAQMKLNGLEYPKQPAAKITLHLYITNVRPIG